MTTTTIQIEGMRCDGCARSVRESLLRVPGVKEAAVDHATGRASVEHDPQRADAGALVKAIEGAGFTARSGKA